MIKLPTISPKQIYDILERNIIGQTEAKRAISNTLYLHYVNLQYKKTFNTDKSPQNANTLLMGPSGNGKTLLIQEGVKAIRELTGYSIMPIVTIDCTQLGAGGSWAGADLSDLLVAHSPGLSKEEMETTVVYLDEVDKLCMPAVGSGGTDFNKQIQYTLLKAMEGEIITCETSREYKQLKTHNMLFVLSGNFPDVRKKRDDEKKQDMGFVQKQVSDKPKDLVKQLQDIGMATQFAGRIGKVLEIPALTKRELSDIASILIVPKIIKLYDFMGYTLHIPHNLIEGFAQEALDNKTGARGLQSAFNKYLEDILFEQEYVLEYPTTQLTLIPPKPKIVVSLTPELVREEIITKPEYDLLVDDRDLDPNADDDEYFSDEETEEYLDSLKQAQEEYLESLDNKDKDDE